MFRTIIVLSLLYSTSALADCAPIYQAMVKTASVPHVRTNEHFVSIQIFPTEYFKEGPGKAWEKNTIKAETAEQFSKQMDFNPCTLTGTDIIDGKVTLKYEAHTYTRRIWYYWIFADSNLLARFLIDGNGNYSGPTTFSYVNVHAPM